MAESNNQYEVSVDESLKSEEIQEIIDRMPTKWSVYVAIIAFLFIGLVFILGLVIKYPDTVDGQISMTAYIAPVRLVSNVSGKLHLLKPNKSILCEGEVIAYLDNDANYNDVIFLDSLLMEFNRDSTYFFSSSLKLGDIAVAYNTFNLIYSQYKQLLVSDIYYTMCQTLKQQIDIDEKIVSNMEFTGKLKQEQLNTLQCELEKDSLLFLMNAITEDSFHEKKRIVLSQQEVLVNLKSANLSKLSEIAKNRLEIQRLTLERDETIIQLVAELTSAYNKLISAIHTWKKTYLQNAPIGGVLEYLGFWHENSYIQAGQELFSVLPKKNEFIGEVVIPSYGVGKVAIGQTANVKLNNFPFDEYGKLQGEVYSIAHIVNKIETNEGIVDAYQVLIVFPDGMITNFGIQLPVDMETKGIVEIVTNPKRLIERLFDNLKAKTEK